MFGMNMPCISSSEAKHAYFISGEARMKHTLSRFTR